MSDGDTSAGGKERDDLLVDTGCATCDHVLTEAALGAVECEHTLLRDAEDARYYLTGEINKRVIFDLIDRLGADADNTDAYAEHEAGSELEKAEFQAKASGIRHAIRELDDIATTGSDRRGDAGDE